MTSNDEGLTALVERHLFEMTVSSLCATGMCRIEAAVEALERRKRWRAAALKARAKLEQSI